MSNRIILPLSTHRMGPTHYPEASAAAQARLSAWLHAQADYMRSVWAQPPAALGAGGLVSADAPIQVLLHHRFNHQSKGRLAHLLPALRSTLDVHIANGRPIPLFLLYNGGYRASPFPDGFEHIFESDQTEFMLLLQIARLQAQITAVYAPGIECVIVVNNGVARWVNGIAPEITQAYAMQLRQMIQSLGASAAVSVLLQSELSSFTDALPWTPPPSLPTLSEKEHRIVERFLGRTCHAQEAQHLSALYVHAENTWGQLLQPLVKAKGAVVFRQVAHPHSLSFRPFPGGAIRTQNGSVGFEEQGETQVPKLITSENFNHFQIELAHIDCARIAAAQSPAPTTTAH